MRTFRKVVLPLVWVVIFSVIAVSLASMAFGSDPQPQGSGLEPTGTMTVRNTVVERGTVENILQVQGSISVDPPVDAKASEDGVINHFFVPVGAKVEAGDLILQIRAEGEEAPGSATDDREEESEPAPRPRARYINVVATKPGKVGSFAKELGDPVSKGDVVASVRRQTFTARGAISAIDQYRLLDPPRSATVGIPGGPAPFTCRDLSIGGAADVTAPVDDPEMTEADEMGDPESSGGGAAISCRVPGDVRVFDQLDMTMSVEAGRAEDVLVVPVTAVRGLVKRGSVWVTGDGEPVERKVRLGLSDGELVEVRKGLSEGESILEFVPGASPGDGEDGEYSGEMSG